MDAMRDIRDMHEELAAWRRDLHAHPETAFEECRTSDFIAEKLTGFGLEVYRGLAGTGVVATLTHGTNGRVIGLRADMDALFLQEENDFAHRSQNDGKMHACGHDGHSTMLLGAARYLARNRRFDGTVRFIFQPAEETGNEERGGNRMVRDGLFERFPVDAVFGMHNFPGIPLGHFSVRTGPMLASIDTFEFKVLSEHNHPATQFTSPAIPAPTPYPCLISRSTAILPDLALSSNGKRPNSTCGPSCPRLSSIARHPDHDSPAVTASR